MDEIIIFAKLFCVTSLLIILSVVLDKLDATKKFQEIKYWKKQVLFGVLFGLITMFCFKYNG